MARVARRLGSEVAAVYPAGGATVILVRSDMKGKGLGWLLMQMILEYSRAEGLKTIEGQVLRENVTMLAMCREFGFDITIDPNNSDVWLVRKAIAGQAASSP